MNVENFVNDLRTIQRNVDISDLKQKIFELGQQYGNLDLNIPIIINFIADKITDGDELVFFIEDLPLSSKNFDQFITEVTQYCQNYFNNRSQITPENFRKDFQKISSVKNNEVAQLYLKSLTEKYGTKYEDIRTFLNNIHENINYEELLIFANNLPPYRPKKFNQHQSIYLVDSELLNSFLIPQEKIIVSDVINDVKKYYESFITERNKNYVLESEEKPKTKPTKKAEIDKKKLNLFPLEEFKHEINQIKKISDPKEIINVLAELKKKAGFGRKNLSDILDLIIKNVHHDDILFFIHGLAITGDGSEKIVDNLRDQYNDYWTYRNQVETTNILARIFKRNKIPEIKIIRKNINEVIKNLTSEINSSQSGLPPPTYLEYLTQNRDVFDKFLREKNDSEIPEIILNFFASEYTNFADYYYKKPVIARKMQPNQHMNIGIYGDESSDAITYRDKIFSLPSIKNKNIQNFYLSNETRKSGAITKYVNAEKPLSSSYDNRYFYEANEQFFQVLYNRRLRQKKAGKSFTIFASKLLASESSKNQLYFMVIYRDINGKLAYLNSELIHSILGDIVSLRSKPSPEGMSGENFDDTQSTLMDEENEMMDVEKLPPLTYRDKIFSLPSVKNRNIQNFFLSNETRKSGAIMKYVDAEKPLSSSYENRYFFEANEQFFELLYNGELQQKKSGVSFTIVEPHPLDSAPTSSNKKLYFMIAYSDIYGNITYLDSELIHFISKDIENLSYKSSLKKISRKNETETVGTKRKLDDQDEDKSFEIYDVKPLEKYIQTPIGEEFEEYIMNNTGKLLKILPRYSFSIDTNYESITAKINKLINFLMSEKDVDIKFKKYFSRRHRGDATIDQIIKNTAEKILSMPRSRKANIGIIYVTNQFIHFLPSEPRESHEEDFYEDEYFQNYHSVESDDEDTNEEDWALDLLEPENYHSEKLSPEQKRTKYLSRFELPGTELNMASRQDQTSSERMTSKLKEQRIDAEKAISELAEHENIEDVSDDRKISDYVYDLKDPDFIKYLQSQKAHMSHVMQSPLWETKKVEKVRNILRSFVRFLVKDDQLDGKFKLFFSRKVRGDIVIDDIIHETAQKIINMSPSERAAVDEIYLMRAFIDYRSPEETDNVSEYMDNEEDEFGSVAEEPDEYIIEDRSDLTQFKVDVIKNLRDVEELSNSLVKWVDFLIDDPLFPSNYKDLLKKYKSPANTFRENIIQVARSIQLLPKEKIQDINIHYLVRKILEKMDVFSPVFHYQDKYDYKNKFFNLSLFQKPREILSVWISEIPKGKSIKYYIDNPDVYITFQNIKFFEPNENFYKIFFTEMMKKEITDDGILTVTIKEATENKYNRLEEKSPKIKKNQLQMRVIYQPKGKSAFLSSKFQVLNKNDLTKIIMDKEVLKITVRNTIQKSQCKMLHRRADWIPNVKYVFIKSKDDIRDYIVDDSDESNPINMKKLVRNPKRVSPDPNELKANQNKYLYEKKYPQIEDGWKLANDNFFDLLCSGQIEYKDDAIVVDDGVKKISFNLAYLTENIVSDSKVTNILTEYSIKNPFTSSFDKILNSSDQLTILQELVNIINLISADPYFPPQYKNYFFKNKEKSQFKFTLSIISREILHMDRGNKSKIDIEYIINRILKKMDVDYMYKNLNEHVVQNKFIVQTSKNFMNNKKYIDEELAKYQTTIDNEEKILLPSISTPSVQGTNNGVLGGLINKIKTSDIDDDTLQVGHRYLENIIYKQNANFNIKHFYDTAQWLPDAKKKILSIKSSNLLLIPSNTNSYQLIDDNKNSILYNNLKLYYPNSLFYECMSNYNFKTVNASGDVLIQYKDRDYKFQMGFYLNNEEDTEFVFYNIMMWEEEQKFLTRIKTSLDSYIKLKAYYDNLNVNFMNFYNDPPWLKENFNFEPFKQIKDIYHNEDSRGNKRNIWISVSENDLDQFQSLINKSSAIYNFGKDWYIPTMQFDEIFHKSIKKTEPDNNGIIQMDYDGKKYKFALGRQTVKHTYRNFLINKSNIEGNQILFYIPPEHVNYYIDIIQNTQPDYNVIDEYNNIWYVPNNYFYDILRNFNAKEIIIPPTGTDLELVKLYTDTKIYQLLIGFVSPRFRGILVQDSKMFEAEVYHVKRNSSARDVIQDSNNLLFESEKLNLIHDKFPLQHMELRWKLILLRYINRIQKFLIDHSSSVEMYVNWIAKILPISHENSLFFNYIRNCYYKVGGIFNDQNPEILNMVMNVKPEGLMKLLIENNKTMILTEIINKKLPVESKKYPSIIYNQKYKAFLPENISTSKKELNPEIYDLDSENETFLTWRTYDVENLTSEMTNISL